MNNAAKAVASKFVTAYAGYTVSDHGLVMTVRKFGEIAGAVSKNGDAWTSVVERGATSTVKTLTAALMNIHAAVEAEEAARIADEQTIETLTQPDEIIGKAASSKAASSKAASSKAAAEREGREIIDIPMSKVEPADLMGVPTSPTPAPKRSALASNLMYGVTPQMVVPVSMGLSRTPALKHVPYASRSAKRDAKAAAAQEIMERDAAGRKALLPGLGG